MNAPLPRYVLRLGRVLVTSAVLLGLLAPLLSPLAGTDLWGWLPEHGHATAGGIVPEHVHPWEVPPSDAGTPRHAEGADLVFTPGDLLGTTAVPVVSVALLVIPLLARHAVRTPRAVSVRALAFAPEPPPPR